VSLRHPTRRARGHVRMRVVGDLEMAIGLAVVVATFGSVTSTFVVPRSRPGAYRVAVLVNRFVLFTALVITRGVREYERKDSVLAFVAPVALLGQLVVFLLLFLAGYSVALLPYASSLPAAIELAASSLFTATLAHVAATGDATIEVMAAVTGAVAIALQIGYLPALYQAFNRREALVTLMEARAGVPAWGPELLMRHQLISSLEALGPLYQEWEQWAADLAESHVSYPILLFFRSPEPGYSFVLSLLAILDAAALQLSLAPLSTPKDARMCLRMGFTALRRIARTLGWEYDADPDPDDAIALSFEEFAAVVRRLEELGFALERGAEEAWVQFSGWRVNYESIAYRLADRVVGPPAPGSGGRQHMPGGVMLPDRPPHRAPGGGTVADSRFRGGS
jgi:hypothetical protein